MDIVRRDIPDMHHHHLDHQRIRIECIETNFQTDRSHLVFVVSNLHGDHTLELIPESAGYWMMDLVPGIPHHHLIRLVRE
jgi:hypothetical protein